MKISTKGRYGLRVLLDVALHEDDGVVSLRDISRRQAISQKYLWQVVTPLKAAGLLRAVRGTQGGYALARAQPTFRSMTSSRSSKAPIPSWTVSPRWRPGRASSSMRAPSSSSSARCSGR